VQHGMIAKDVIATAAPVPRRGMAGGPHDNAEIINELYSPPDTAPRSQIVDPSATLAAPA